MVDNNCIIEGNVKFRDGKKWKSRWCVMRKLSPVADCLHLQLYGDSKDRYKQGQTKASLSLQHFLGVESGFTLDKESNTVAIICQDVTVVLAFDTRERLIQWQVKISNNLGEDQQFLILISTAPAKAKLTTGPAHLHIQDRRFCLTVGVPPRVVGIWDIAHLRRFGVIEGRFCFEGGSRCGRGEGLHVLITDQGDDIVKTLQLAAEGRLSVKKRPGVAHEHPMNQNSPGRQFSRSETRTSEFFPSAVYTTASYDDHCDSCKNEGSSSCWSSSESRQCPAERSGQGDLEAEFGSRDIGSVNNLERCASCIGKLGTITKSTPLVTGTVPASSPALGTGNPNHHVQLRAFDRLSLSSYSSSSHESDYSVSQQVACQCAMTKLPMTQCSTPSPVVSPPRPPKTTFTCAKVTKKPPMPLPCTCRLKASTTTGPYENYDVPKTILSQQPTTDRYYDTPRKIKECLAVTKSYANYDTPVVLQRCGCPAKIQPSQSPRSSSSSSFSCPCHNVMTWAGFVLPYCRRGAGIEATGVSVKPVRLSGEGRMPVVNARGEVAIYATTNNEKTVTMKKDSCDCPAGRTGNYENVEPVVIESQPNYANINFTESLEHYENGKDLLLKTGISRDEVKEFAEELKVENVGTDERSAVCDKCGHVKAGETDYLVMDLDKGSPKKPFLSYLPMQPAHNACSKETLTRICNGTKSSSNPTLSGTISIEGNRKRSESEYRVPGSAMLSSPYLRRRLVDPMSSIETTTQNGLLLRKRSYSAESAHHLEDDDPTFSSTVNIHKCSSGVNKSASVNSGEHNSGETSSASSQPSLIKIRRSSSVPSKTGHNRDSSSSNDSGVSTGSLSHRGPEFVDFEPTALVKKNLVSQESPKSPTPICFHASLPRKSKSSDPLRELSFQFQRSKLPTKSSSADADIPACVPKSGKGFGSPNEVSAVLHIDSRSTSSGTSDMSDYIETLSLSSHSSSDTPDNLRLGGRAVATTLRPRSGKEYYKIDRSILVEQSRTMANYANITPVLEKSESPSPGYMSSSPYEQPQPTRDHFLFPEQA